MVKVSESLACYLKPAGLKCLGSAVLAMAVMFVSHLVLETYELVAPLRLSVALLPVPFFAVFLYYEVRAIMGLDELQRQIHLVSLGIAVPVTFLGFLTVEFLRDAGFVPVGIEEEIWVYLVLGPWIVSYFFVRRRYR